MLIGEYTHSVDAKGRIILPAKFREDMGSHFYVTIGFDKCLRAYPFLEWNKYMENISALPDSDEGARKFKRAIGSNSFECEIDKQGRVLISGKLREYAVLNEDVVIIGQTTYIEFWNKDIWDAYNQTEGYNIDDLAGMMASYGL